MIVMRPTFVMTFAHWWSDKKEQKRQIFKIDNILLTLYLASYRYFLINLSPRIVSMYERMKQISEYHENHKKYS